jgi:hypothetical protein
VGDSVSRPEPFKGRLFVTRRAGQPVNEAWETPAACWRLPDVPGLALDPEERERREALAKIEISRRRAMVEALARYAGDAMAQYRRIQEINAAASLQFGRYVDPVEPEEAGPFQPPRRLTMKEYRDRLAEIDRKEFALLGQASRYDALRMGGREISRAEAVALIRQAAEQLRQQVKAETFGESWANVTDGGRLEWDNLFW